MVAPLSAGLKVTVISSPFLTRFGPVAVTPAFVSTLADPVVSYHTLTSPFLSLMAMCSAPCGFVNANF